MTIATHKSRQHPVRVEAAYKQNLAMRLRIKGYSYRQIAKKLGIVNDNPETAVYTLIRSGINSVRLDSAEEMRNIELTRLDALQVIAWAAIEKAAKRGDVRAVSTGVNSIVRLSDRRAKLMGLDAPVKYDLLMSEARKMAQQLEMPENEFMALCEQTAAEAWGKD